jgi:hypothetical protein
MPDLPVTKTVKIKECDYNEHRLRNQIADDSSILGLGDLVCAEMERRHFEGGRLDLLLERPRDGARYEVELQLGKTNESHIIRTIEYWDREKRKSPMRKHTAVLVAEEITTRFFNVVQLLSRSVPFIGIQVKIAQVGDVRALDFTIIINTSAEDEDDEDDGPEISEKDWRDKYPAAHECAMWYKDLLTKAGGDVRAKFSKGWITLYVRGKVRASVPARKNNRAQIYIQKLNEKDLEEAETRLNVERTIFTRTEENHLVFTGNLNELKATIMAHEWIAERIAKEN